VRFSRLSDWLAWQEQLHPRAIDLGLDRLRRTLHALGWQRPPCPIITVGGTNGKGSTVALLTRILTESGYRVGTFSSPHLIRYNERIRIAEREIDDASLLVAFERIDAARGDQTLTFFEFNALAALLVFETAGVDAIVLEVGMGGRLDAANVVDADAAVICSIALDHCEWLGSDVETIGIEKAGILRPTRPAILGSRQMPSSVAGVAEQLGADVQQLGRDFDWLREEKGWSWRGRAQHYERLPPPALRGEIQLDNASASLAVLAELSDRLPVDRAAIERALRTVNAPGRFQIINTTGSEIEWVLDVGHNPAAAQTLARALSDSPRRSPTIAVFAALADKDIAGIMAELAGSFDGWVVAQLPGVRALATSVLAQRLREASANVLAECGSVAEACAYAETRASGAGRVVVFGSFLTVGPALEWLQLRCVT
jgi:dihydrofolate synthase/folylpolyglutamate synthase